MKMKKFLALTATVAMAVSYTHLPNCQAVLKEVWIDKRRAEVIDSPYFHVVFTLPVSYTHLSVN